MKRMKEVDRVIADLDAKIETLQSTRKLLIESKVTVAHARTKTTKASKPVVVPKDAA